MRHNCIFCACCYVAWCYQRVRSLCREPCHVLPPWVHQCLFDYLFVCLLLIRYMVLILNLLVFFKGSLLVFGGLNSGPYTMFVLAGIGCCSQDGWLDRP